MAGAIRPRRQGSEVARRWLAAIAPHAQKGADALARTARRPSRLAQDGPVWAHVVRLLREHHSPEQIAGILRRMQPDAPTLQVSHETIYTALYAMPRGELRTELIAGLRQARKSRMPGAGAKIAGVPFPTWSASICAPRKSPSASFPDTGRVI